MTPLARMYAKLCREQSQAEHSTELHPRRVARRLGDSPPGRAFRALSAHANRLAPAFKEALGPGHRFDLLAGLVVAKMFSGSRYLLLDHLTEPERSYRGTLLGLKHGVDCARLLTHVATAGRQPLMAGWCARMLAERLPLLADAEDALAWFAAHPGRAIAR